MASLVLGGFHLGFSIRTFRLVLHIGREEGRLKFSLTHRGRTQGPDRSFSLCAVRVCRVAGARPASQWWAVFSPLAAALKGCGDSSTSQRSGTSSGLSQRPACPHIPGCPAACSRQTCNAVLYDCALCLAHVPREFHMKVSTD